MSSMEDRPARKWAGLLGRIKRLTGGGERSESNFKRANDSAERRLSEFLEKEFGTSDVNEMAVFPRWLTDESVKYYCKLFDEDIRIIRDRQESQLKLLISLGLVAIVAGLWVASFGGIYLVVGAVTIVIGLALCVGTPRALPPTPSAKIGNQELFVLLRHQDVAREFLSRINEQRGRLG